MSTSLDEALGAAPEPKAIEQEPQKADEVPPVEEAEAEPVADPVAEATESQAKPDDSPMVPLKALHEVRDSNRELKRQIEALQSQKPPEKAPDVFEDPEGYRAHMENKLNQQLETQRLNLAEDMVRGQHGDAVVDAAIEAFEPHKGTALHSQLLAAANPFRELVKWHQRESAQAQIGDDPIKWMQEKEAQIRAEVEAQAAVKQTKAAPAAPSLAAETNTGARTGPSWAGPTPLDQIL